MTPLGSRTDIGSSSPRLSLDVTPSASASWSTLSASVSPSSSGSVSVSPVSSVSAHISAYTTPTSSASATNSRSAYATPTAIPTVYYNTVYTSTETSQAGIIIGSTSLGTLLLVLAGVSYYLRKRCRLNTDIYKEPGDDTEVKAVDPEPESVVVDQVVEAKSDNQELESKIAVVTVIDMINSISDAV